MSHNIQPDRLLGPVVLWRSRNSSPNHYNPIYCICKYIWNIAYTKFGWCYRNFFLEKFFGVATKTPRPEFHRTLKRMIVYCYIYVWQKTPCVCSYDTFDFIKNKNETSRSNCLFQRIYPESDLKVLFIYLVVNLSLWEYCYFGQMYQKDVSSSVYLHQFSAFVK